MPGEIQISARVERGASSGSENVSPDRPRMPTCYIVDEDPQICHFISLIMHGQGLRTE